MAEVPELKYFTAKQLRDWLEGRENVDGLSEAVIAPQRAWAIVRNPFVTDDMELVSALFVDGELAAYTACFPDLIERPEKKLIFWCTTLFCKPEFRGRGYGMFVLGHLMEAHEGLLFDVDAVDETNEGLKYLGMQVDFFDQYILRFAKSIRGIGLKASLARGREFFAARQRAIKAQNVYRQCIAPEYTLSYSRHIDEPTYNFITAHCKGDAFLRSRETLNWILLEPFLLSAPVSEKLGPRNNFASEVPVFGFYCVTVRVKGEIAGVYILRASTQELSVKYLYYEEDFQQEVFSSIAAHLIRLSLPEFATNDAALSTFIESLGLHVSSRVIQRSFAHPMDFSFDGTARIQAGDGDMIT